MKSKQSRSLLLLSDSHDKRAGGQVHSSRQRSICAPAYLPREVSQRLLSARNEIRQMLQGDTVRLYNETQKGGYRDERKCNQRLLAGPDFNGTASSAKAYLPAYRRYTGRYFTTIERAAPDFWSTIVEYPIEIVFVSGLYGLILYDEEVQNYDCYPGDCTIERRPRTVAQIWKDTLTDALCSFVVQQNRQAEIGKIRYVYDLLSEDTFQGMFDWEKIAGSCGSVFHRAFMNFSGPDILSRIALVMARHLTSFCEGATQFQRQTLYTVPDETPPVHFAFEYPIGAIPQADREGELEDIRKQFGKEFPHLERFFPQSLRQLALAEYSLRKTQSIRKFDHGVLIVSFAKSVEHVLRTVCPNPIPPDKRTFGQLVGDLKDRRVCFHVWRQLDQLHELRDSGAHSARILTQNDLNEAKHLALEVLSKMKSPASRG